MIFLLFQYNIEKKEDSDADEEDDEDDDFGGGPSKKPVDDDPVARKLDSTVRWCYFELTPKVLKLQLPLLITMMEIMLESDKKFICEQDFSKIDFFTKDFATGFP